MHPKIGPHFFCRYFGYTNTGDGEKLAGMCVVSYLGGRYAGIGGGLQLYAQPSGATEGLELGQDICLDLAHQRTLEALAHPFAEFFWFN